MRGPPCFDIGVDVLEVDARHTKDAKLFVIYDETLDRSTTGTELVSDHNLPDILRLKLRNRDGFGRELSTSHPPGLEDFLTAVKGKSRVAWYLVEDLGFRFQPPILSDRLSLPNGCHSNISSLAQSCHLLRLPWNRILICRSENWRWN